MSTIETLSQSPVESLEQLEPIKTCQSTSSPIGPVDQIVIDSLHQDLYEDWPSTNNLDDLSSFYDEFKLDPGGQEHL